MIQFLFVLLGVEVSVLVLLLFRCRLRRPICSRLEKIRNGHVGTLIIVSFMVCMLGAFVCSGHELFKIHEKGNFGSLTLEDPHLWKKHILEVLLIGCCWFFLMVIYGFPSQRTYPLVTMCSCVGREEQTLVSDLLGTLLRSQSPFPYFMLVAFESGSLLRAFFLLVSYPFLLLLIHEHLSLRVMIFITFCGLTTKNMDTVAKAVLPKFFLEDLNLYSHQVMSSTGRKVVLTSMPKVMVERFLKEYLSVNEVIGTELHVVGDGHFFSGLLSGYGIVIKHRALIDLFGEATPDLALGCSSFHGQNLFMSLCREAYVVSKESVAVMPREMYPKRLVFHDGRLAFFPTPFATLILFLWLPLGVILAITRTFLGTCLPYRFGVLASASTGFTIRVTGEVPVHNQRGRRGVLFACTHRTMMDPVVVSIALRRSITAVTYSLSRVSELIAPIRTVRLTRNRETDGATMRRLLEEGDLVVCPEGTTCREPYLLRFSSLFAELTDDIVPVAVDVKVTMFYATTTTGYKWLDPFFLLMNPKPTYTVEFLPTVPAELTCSGGLSSREVANAIQMDLANALGFECTRLTRRNKYLMLAGNEGIST